MRGADLGLYKPTFRNPAIRSLRGVLGGVPRRRRAIGAATRSFRQQLAARIDGLLFRLVQDLQ